MCPTYVKKYVICTIHINVLSYTHIPIPSYFEEISRYVYHRYICVIHNKYGQSRISKLNLKVNKFSVPIVIHHILDFIKNRRITYRVQKTNLYSSKVSMCNTARNAEER